MVPLSPFWGPYLFWLQAHLVKVSVRVNIIPSSTNHEFNEAPKQSLPTSAVDDFDFEHGAEAQQQIEGFGVWGYTLGLGLRVSA